MTLTSILRSIPGVRGSRYSRWFIARHAGWRVTFGLRRNTPAGTTCRTSKLIECRPAHLPEPQPECLYDSLLVIDSYVSRLRLFRRSGCGFSPQVHSCAGVLLARGRAVFIAVPRAVSHRLQRVLPARRLPRLQEPGASNTPRRRAGRTARSPRFWSGL